jgi:hypothetical protein
MEYSISYIAGFVISLGLSFLPKLNTWYDKYTPKQKQLIIAAVMAIVTILIAGLSCTDLQIVGIPVYECTPQGLGALFTSFLSALAGGVTAHQSTNKIKG